MWFFFFLIAILFAVNLAHASDVASDGNSIFVQGSPGEMVYELPLNVTGVHDTLSAPRTGWRPLDLSGDGSDENACLLYFDRLICTDGTDAVMGGQWRKVDSGSGFIALRNPQTPYTLLRSGGLFYTLPPLWDVDFTEDLVCGVLTTGAVGCWDELGTPVHFPAIANARKIELGTFGPNDSYATILYADGRVDFYEFASGALYQIGDDASDIAMLGTNICIVQSWTVSCTDIFGGPIEWNPITVGRSIWLFPDANGVPVLVAMGNYNVTVMSLN